MPTLTDLPPQVRPAEFIKQAIERFENEAASIRVGDEMMFKAHTASCRSFITDSKRYDELANAVTRTAKTLGFRRFKLEGDEFHFVREQLIQSR